MATWIRPLPIYTSDRASSNQVQERWPHTQNTHNTLNQPPQKRNPSAHAYPRYEIDEGEAVAYHEAAEDCETHAVEREDEEGEDA